jgi:hypothetical protein
MQKKSNLGDVLGGFLVWRKCNQINTQIFFALGIFPHPHSTGAGSFFASFGGAGATHRNGPDSGSNPGGLGGNC